MLAGGPLIKADILPSQVRSAGPNVTYRRSLHGEILKLLTDFSNFPSNNNPPTTKVKDETAAAHELTNPQRRIRDVIGRKNKKGVNFSPEMF